MAGFYQYPLGLIEYDHCDFAEMKEIYSLLIVYAATPATGIFESRSVQEPPFSVASRSNAVVAKHRKMERATRTAPSAESKR